MPLRRIVVFGASGHAKVVIDAIRRAGAVEVAGVLDAGRPAGETFFGAPVLGSDAALAALLADEPALGGIVAIGDNGQRAALAERIAGAFPAFAFIPVVHPAAVVAADATIGPGAFVAAGATINASAAIGAHAIVNTNASVDHDCTVGDFASIGPNAALGGGVTVGRCSHVGLGASVIQGIAIGVDSTVGAGAAVIHDVPDCTLVVGVPAAPKKRIGPEDRRGASEPRGHRGRETAI